VYWLENRPAEGGRCTVVQRSVSGRISERTPAAFNVRSTVHEYGGGAFTVDKGIVYAVNFIDQRIYKQVPGSPPSPLTPENGSRYADLIVDHRRRRLLCIQENHARPGEPANTIAAVDLDGSGSQTLVWGSDFYSNPRLSPDGSLLAYLTWNLPNMPWDGCELHLAEIDANGAVGPMWRVAGGSSEAIFQPEWSPGGILHFVSDSTGWWNLYRWNAGAASPLCPMPAEFGRAMWSFGYSTYGFAAENRILCCYTESGIDHLAWLEVGSRKLEPINSPYTKIDLLRCAGAQAAFIGASPASPPEVVRMDLGTSRLEALEPAFAVQIDTAYLSSPVATEWTLADGQRTHGLYYPPANPEYAPLEAERPPLLVLCHGGPTSAASTALRYAVQFWTSRGFVVLDVNYGGSTGYGREYRRRLNGRWGVIDVEDCCGSAQSLAQHAHVDRARMAIKGGSAGGYTALACLATRNEVFAAGSVYYGISDLELLVKSSPKFESRSLDTLIGPYPERRDLYLARSPIRHVKDLRCPLILFQGDDDRIVPLAQSQLMFEAVRRKGLPTTLLRFHGEGHGFRRAESLRRAQEAELYFLSKIFRFPLYDSVTPIPIENLPTED